MTLTLDMRAPTIVLVAQFNPAIFTPQWIARFLFDKKEGEDMEVLEMIAQSERGIAKFSFFEGVAISVASERTELLALNGQPETLANVESVLLKMLDVLPHTPLSAIGCNLNYVDDSAAENVTSFFQTPEGLEGEGKLNLRQSTVQLQLVAPEILNFSRIMTDQNVRYTFNYHRPETDLERYKEFVPGLIAKSIQHSETLLKSYYGYESHEVVGFAFPEIPPQDADNAPETIN